MNIADVINTYTNKLDYLDIELILTHSLGKTREFVLTYPEQTITKVQETKIKKNIARRIKGEPVAYILGHKEFYGLDFIVNKHTLVPRPETEQIVELVLDESKVKGQRSKIVIMDIGTGSGNIIISIAKAVATSYELLVASHSFFASDISSEALKIAKKNAKKHGVDKKIKFMHGSLLLPIIENCKLKIENATMIIVANLPYLSKEIYQSAPIDVKKFEPKSALYSAEDGLAHYRKLLEQIKKFLVVSHQPASTRGDDRSSTRGGSSVILLLEFSPEQKQSLAKLAKDIFPSAEIEFKKDLAGKWRICKIQAN